MDGAGRCYGTNPRVGSGSKRGAIDNFRLYRSTDYDRASGQPTDPNDNGASWPVWDTDMRHTLGENHYFGSYVEEPQNRSATLYDKGPAILSDEDIFAVFKDTDPGRYEMGRQAALDAGYPLGLQFEQTAYSWGVVSYRDFIIIRYRIVNRSSDTLYDCWVGPAIDFDIGLGINDHIHSAIPEDRRDNDTLNLAVAWSETESVDYGYFGCDILESPAVDNTGFIRKDKGIYPGHEQLGLKTLVNWVIDIDPKTPEERYDFMARGTLDGDNGAGDKRMMAATGPFSMLPGDTAHLAFGLLFAPGAGSVRTGQWEDITHLIELSRFAQMVYDSMRSTSGVEESGDGWRPWRMDLR